MTNTNMTTTVSKLSLEQKNLLEANFYLSLINKIFRAEPKAKSDIQLLQHWSKVYNQTNNSDHVAKAYNAKTKAKTNAKTNLIISA